MRSVFLWDEARTDQHCASVQRRFSSKSSCAGRLFLYLFSKPYCSIQSNFDSIISVGSAAFVSSNLWISTRRSFASYTYWVSYRIFYLLILCKLVKPGRISVPCTTRYAEFSLFMEGGDTYVIIQTLKLRYSE